MEQKQVSVRSIVLESKPINLYGYTIIVSILICGLSVFYEYIGSYKAGVLHVVILTMIVPILSYLFRFYWSRNNLKLREKIESAESEDEASKLIFGGYLYGISVVLVMALVFYLTLKELVL